MFLLEFSSLTHKNPLFIILFVLFQAMRSGCVWFTWLKCCNHFVPLLQYNHCLVFGDVLYSKPGLSYILSRLDYCNCLLMGTPNSVIQPLQKIQNFAARLVLLAPRHHHSTPLLEKLHWLPISERIKYNVACMCFSVINGSGLLTSLNCCMSTLHLVHYVLLLTPACSKSNNTNARLMAFAPSLALDPTFGIHSHRP